MFAASSGSDFGFELFDAWSRKREDKYDFIDTMERWRKFKTSPPDVITVGTLIYEANRAEFKAEMEAWEAFRRASRAAL